MTLQLDLTFQQAFRLATDDSLDLIHMLQDADVLYKTMSCPACQSSMTIMRRATKCLDGYVWQCHRKACQKRVSIRKDSWFALGHISIGKQILLLFCFFRYDKMLSKDIADIVGIEEHTMVNWSNFVRESISHYFLEEPLKLGREHPVQIDESLFGGRCKYHRGDHATHTQSWVFGMVEEVTGLNVLWTVDDRRRKTLFSIIKDHIHDGAIIKSDEWAAYKSLDEHGYQHLAVNHSLGFISAEGVHTQLIEGLWSQVKSILKIRRGTQASYLPGYLDLYSFRSLAKHSSKTPFRLFLDAVIRINKVY